MAIACYLRVSSDEQKKKETIATQREQLDRFAVKHQIAIDDTYADDGVSGTVPIDQRPEGRRLIADARAGRIQRLLVYKLDRLGRDALVTLSAIDVLHQCSVEIVSITQSFDLKTPHGKFQAVIDCGVTGYERDTLVERSIDGSRRIAREGGWLGGRAPFGYRLSGTARAGRMVPSEVHIPHLDTTEADIVREMYRLVVVDDRSSQYVADWLNSIGVPTMYAREGTMVKGQAVPGVWSPARVRRVINSPTYKGEQTYGKPKNGGQEPITREVPPLVSPDLWQAAQDALTRRRKFSSRNAKHDYLLRGLIKCGNCNRTYVGNFRPAVGKKKIDHTYYYCTGRRKARELGQDPTPCAVVNGDTLEQYIWDKLAEWSVNPESFIAQAWAQVDSERETIGSVRDGLTKARRKLTALTTERNLAITLFRKGRISEAELDRQLDEADAEKRDLDAQIESLRARGNAASENESRLLAFNAIMSDLRHYLGAAKDFGEKRRIIERCIDGITVTTANGETAIAIAFSFDRLHPEIVVREAAHGDHNSQPHYSLLMEFAP